MEQGFFGYGDAQWTAFWELSRQAGPADTLAALRESGIDIAKEIRVRTVRGDFRRICDCLLPGKVVPGDGSRDAHIAVDLEFHDPDRLLLRDLGLREGPVPQVDPTEESWYEDYVESRWRLYCKKLPASASRPQVTTMRFDGANPAGPLRFLTELSREGRAAFLRELPAHGLVTSWTMQVGRQQATRQRVISPLVWMARTHGWLETSRGLRQVTRCVSPLLRAHADVLPVADVPANVAEALKLPGTLEEIREPVWKELVEEASTSEDDSFPGKVYALLFEAGAEWPDGVATRCRVGDGWTCDRPDEEIAVTADRAEYEALIRERIPALLAPTEAAADQMRRTWGMLAPSDVIRKELRFVQQGEPVLLLEEFPHLRLSHHAKVDGWRLVRCDELEEIIRTPNGMRVKTVDAAIHERSVLVLRPENDLAALMAVDRELRLNLGRQGCEAILERREQQRRNERMRRAREAPDIASKVLELVGEEALKRGLPQGLIESEEAETGKTPDAHRIAQLAVDAHGSAVLRHYSKDIAANVPAAAGSFSGDSKSMQIVNQLGLPESFAGAKGQRLEPKEVVPGPTAFPRLHDYQERLAANMFDLLTRYKAARAMLCLPTGAGKTRVAAEAVIRVIKEQGLQGRPVLWIAQTEELCEQAVQSWKFVWSKVGPPERLTISRLWSTNEAAAVTETHHLVVATDAKLEKCLGTAEYAWLRDPALVLVDEAHTSITPRYTELLSLLGITHRSSARPLIGLTATPFRGFNLEETRRLVERYGGRRLDEGIFEGDPYAELQKLGVLARVEHRELKGATLELSADELEKAERLRFKGWLPTSAEERLASDQERNAMLISEITNLVDDGPILLFATSVNHAKLLAAILKGKGISAAAIDSATPTAERRAVVERFRSGKIRVLTNFGVLAQGFDAPATRTVIVARPTYSPNAYQQMIGRGLRGPCNGGKETCLILDIRDNIVNYDKKLAFTDFEYLWSRNK